MSKHFISLSRALLLLALVLAPAVARAGAIRQVTVADAINPVTARFISDQLRQAEAAGDSAFLLLLDTPGGLVSAMRGIIQGILQAPIPVIVYVAPSGGGAASAGALITMAADFAVMAPGTNIGAASPVSIGLGGGGGMDETMKSKVFNDFIAYSRSIAEQRGRNPDWAEDIVRDARSSSATEALELKVIDLIANDVPSLLTQLEGRKYLRHGQAQIFSAAGAVVQPVEMGWRLRLLSAISNPTLAYMLLMLGILGIFFEISQPGVVLPGVIGGIAILLAFFSFQVLPVNLVGLLLIFLAVVLFVLEIKVVSYGMLSIGGVISLTMGSLILIDSDEPTLQVSRAVIFATVVVASSFILLVLWFVTRTQKTPSISGMDAMIGLRGMATEAMAPGEEGQVLVQGEYWRALSEETVAEGTPIEVVGFSRGLELKVRPLSVPGSEDTHA